MAPTLVYLSGHLNLPPKSKKEREGESLSLLQGLALNLGVESSLGFVTVGLPANLA